MEPIHFSGVAELQRLCFPPPFDNSILWNQDHLETHLDKFPVGQFVALDGDKVVGSCSNTIISSNLAEKRLGWYETVGGLSLSTFDPLEKILFGVDISVHPDYRRQGIGRRFYQERDSLMIMFGLDGYVTHCRIPDFSTSGYDDVKKYCWDVSQSKISDRTLTPLLRYGLTMEWALSDHWDDPESGNAAAMLSRYWI